MADVTKAIKFLILGDDKSAVSALRNVSKEMKSTAKSGTGFKGLGKDLAAAVKSGQGFKGVSGVMKNAASEAGGLKGIVGGVGLGVAAVGAAAIAAGAAIAIKFGSDSVDTFKRVAGEVAKLKRVTGLTTEDASRMAFAFKQSGVDAEKGTKGMQLLSKNLAGAADGGKKAAAMAKLLGFNFTDASGKVLPMSKLMPQLADKFSKMPDGANKTALAMKLFGKSGTDLLPFLNKGAAGLDELAKKSDKFGNTLTDKQLDALKKSKQAQRDWDASMQGLQVTLGATLLPILTDFATGLNANLIPAMQWMAEEIKKNQGGFDAFGNGLKWVWNNILMPVIKYSIMGFANMTKSVGQAIAAIGHMTGNKDMEDFGNSVASVAGDVYDLANGMKEVNYTVTPTIDAKTEEAKAKVKDVDKTIKGLKDKIITAKAKGDTKGLRDAEAALKKAEKKKHELKVQINAYVNPDSNNIRLNINRGGKTGVLRMYANGGRFGPGWAMVGEQGPELVRFDGTGRVFNNRQTRQMVRGGSGGSSAGASGGPVNIYMTVNVPLGGDTTGTARAIRSVMVDLHAKTGLRVP